MPKEVGATRAKFEKITDNVALFQREGMWYANIQWAGKQVRRSLKTDSKKQAKLNALKLAGELSKGQSSGRRDKATIAEVFEMFVDWKVTEGLADRTLAKYRHGIKVATEVADYMGRKRMSQIDPRFMDEFRAYRKKNYGSGNNTIRKDLILVGGIVKFALSRKLLADDPLIGFKIPKAKRAPQPFWSSEEMEQIIKACDRRPHQDIYAVLADTGMRIGELIHLTWEDIDTTSNIIQIRSKKEWKTKTGNHRAVPMTQRVQRLIAAQPRRSKWIFTFAESSRHKTGRQVSARRLLDYLKVRLKRLGLKGHLHTFRHSHASHAIARGVPADVLRSWLGQVDRKTLELYTHIASKTAQAAIRAIEPIEDTSVNTAQASREVETKSSTNLAQSTEDQLCA